MAKYEKYDNYDAINVDRTKDIPKDYYGVMGVPVSFIEKYNPGQFEIVGTTYQFGYPHDIWKDIGLGYNAYINGDIKYKRLFIRRRKYEKYDNYDAINVDRVKDIPKDYYGVMGVPTPWTHKRQPRNRWWQDYVR